MSSNASLASRLLNKGHQLSITNGQVVVNSGSGAPVPDDWLDNHADTLINEILQLTNRRAYRYTDFSTGKYGIKKAGGVTLNFEEIPTGMDRYVIFNVDVTYVRNSKNHRVGDQLPKNHFRPGRRSHFVKFWKRLGLDLPTRRSTFHKHLHKLKPYLFTNDDHTTGSRLSKTSLILLEVPETEIASALAQSDRAISVTEKELDRDKIVTTERNKHSPLANICKGSQPDSSTGTEKYETRQQGKRPKVFSSIPPSEQSTSEWMADYDSDPNMSTRH
jgi:hypothetical protein